MVSLLLGTQRSDQRPECTDSTLRPTGVGAVRLGRTVAEIKQRCPVQSDTIRYSSDSRQGRVLRVVIGSNTVDAWIDGDTVQRIDVTSMGFRTEGGHGVGTSLVRLLGDDTVRGTAGDGWLVVGPGTECGILYAIRSSVRFTQSPVGVEVLRRLPPMKVNEVRIVPCHVEPT
jgi:hypothetical protein